MATIITPFDFIGENVIGQVTSVKAVEESVQIFIDKYEPKFLKVLLGDALYQEFVTGLIPVEVEPPTNPVTYLPIDPKWLYLRDQTDIKPMLIDYVYYWYFRNFITHTTGTAEVMAKNENSTITSAVDKMARAWNEMVDMALEFNLDKTEYPSYVEPVKNHNFSWCGHDYTPVNSIFRKVNTFNI
jgi:hypothetical protein